MIEFATFEAAAAYVWALPYGIGKLFCIAGAYFVSIKGKDFFKKKE